MKKNERESGGLSKEDRNTKALRTLDDNSDNDKDNDYLVYFIAIYVNDYLFLFSPQQTKQKEWLLASASPLFYAL